MKVLIVFVSGDKFEAEFPTIEDAIKLLEALRSLQPFIINKTILINPAHVQYATIVNGK